MEGICASNVLSPIAAIWPTLLAQDHDEEKTK
jgi:hypothetical protein